MIIDSELRIIIAASVAVFAFFSLILVIYLSNKKTTIKPVATSKSISKKSPQVITSHDIRAVAGEDMIATQLDMARAYIEIGRTQLAKKILEHAFNQGNLRQREEAGKLLELL